jgi:Protein of unknown function
MNLGDVSDDDIDALLLATATVRWQKVAMVIAKAMSVYDSCDEVRVGERIIALVKPGELESAGNVRHWRFSEIRLPTKGDRTEE